MNKNQQINVTCNQPFREILMAEFAAIGFDNFQETDNGFITNTNTDVSSGLVDNIIERDIKSSRAQHI